MKANTRVVSVLLLFLMSAFVLSGCASTPLRESTGQYLDSSVITSKIKTRLFEDPLTRGFSISVRTFKDKVQLSGFVSSSRERAQAGVIAAGVDGVGSVENNLLIK